MSSIEFKSMRVKLEGIAGVRVYFTMNNDHRILCIDILNPLNCNYILYTHSHPRHYPGDGIIDKLKDKATVLSPMKGYLIRPGDVVRLDNILVKVVDAYEEGLGEATIHPKGLGVGFIVEFEDKVTLYHMGDTGLINEILNLEERVDLLLIPIGGDGVMNVEEAVEAVKSLKPIITIPIHYTDRRFFFKFRDMVQPYTQVIDLKRSD